MDIVDTPWMSAPHIWDQQNRRPIPRYMDVSYKWGTKSCKWKIIWDWNPWFWGSPILRNLHIHNIYVCIYIYTYVYIYIYIHMYIYIYICMQAASHLYYSRLHGVPTCVAGELGGNDTTGKPRIRWNPGCRSCIGSFFLVGRPQVATSDQRCREMGVLKNDKFDKGQTKYLKYMIQDFDKHGLSSEMGFIL